MVRMRIEALLLAAAIVAPAEAHALTVFACEPEWASLTRSLLPEARIHVATHAGQDPHHIEARPSLIAQLRNADLAVCTGAALESGWLPTLQQRAGNPRVQDVFFAADHASLIDPQPGAIGTPWAGDIHAEGNPHLHTDPRRLLEVLPALSARLSLIAPEEKGRIDERRRALELRWRQQIAQWEQRAAALRGREVVAQHATFGYLWQWLGMRQIADLEPRPGMAPTPGHLQRLLEGLRARPPAAVVIASHHDPRPARWLTSQLGPSVPLLVLPATVTDASSPEALIGWLDGVIEALRQGIKP